MPPLWAFDPIWWRDDHHADFAANGVTNAQALVKKDADNLQRLQLPASAIWLDRPYGSGAGGLGGWGNFDFDPGPTGFPNPEEMAADLARRNMYLIGWIANRANNTMVSDPVFAPATFSAANGFEGNFTTTPALDLRRPEVFAHFKNRLRDGYVKRGMRGFKIDRGEQGEMPAALQNELGDPDRKGGVRGHVRGIGGRRIHLRQERLRPRTQVCRRLERRFQRHVCRDVRFAETAPAARRDHVLDGRVRYRRVRPQSKRRNVCAMARAQRVLADDGDPDRPESDTVVQLRHRAQRQCPARPHHTHVHPGAPRSDSVHPIARLRLDADRHAGDADDAAGVSRRRCCGRHVRRVHVWRCSPRRAGADGRCHEPIGLPAPRACGSTTTTGRPVTRGRPPSRPAPRST